MQKGRQFLYHQKPEDLKSKRSTRHTYAGFYNPTTETLIIGVAGNHPNDSFCKSKGRQIAVGRSLVIRQNLQNNNKQFIIENVKEEQSREIFFDKILKLN